MRIQCTLDLEIMISLAHHLKDFFSDCVNCCNTTAEVSSLIHVCSYQITAYTCHSQYHTSQIYLKFL